MIAHSRLSAACRYIASLDEPLTEDLGNTMVRRLREAGLVEPGRYHLTGPWSRLWVEEGRILRPVEEGDIEARVCRLLETGPRSRGEITQDVQESGGLDRALRYLVRSGYLLGPDYLVLTNTGRKLSEIENNG